MKRYDIIIAGGGMAGLSLCLHLGKSALRSASILLIDRERKTRNDRTWCFWESGKGPFESIVFRKWQTVEFVNTTLSRHLPTRDYTYKMVRGIDFYDYAYRELANLPNLDIIYATVDTITDTPAGGVVRTGEETYTARYVFDSTTPLTRQTTTNQHLLQHFKGWVITTGHDCFDVNSPRLMDFRTPQHADCRFFYILPIDSRTALVEYTVFSQQVLTDQAYTDALTSYIGDFLNTGGYQIRETERGVIPMSDQLQPAKPSQHVIRIGTSGGYTKPSTGYTFQRTQQYLGELVANLVSTGKPTRQQLGLRGWTKRVLDTIFLNVLINNRLPAHELFTRLFTGNDPNRLFRFMNEETTLLDDLRVINSLPKAPFVLAAADSLLNRLRHSITGQWLQRGSASLHVRDTYRSKTDLLSESQPV